MNLWRTITGNYVINVGFTAFFAAQLLKTIFTYLTTRRVVLERMFGSGGMPSSHSSLTCAIAFAVEKSCGYDSPEFGLALTLAAIVMYDAMGVRRAAGEQAKVLNRMIFDFPWFSHENGGASGGLPADSGGEQPQDDGKYEDKKPLLSKELKEYLGHTPFEVMGGCLLGILVALFMPMPAK